VDLLTDALTEACYCFQMDGSDRKPPLRSDSGSVPPARGRYELKRSPETHKPQMSLLGDCWTVLEVTPDSLPSMTKETFRLCHFAGAGRSGTSLRRPDDSDAVQSVKIPP